MPSCDRETVLAVHNELRKRHGAPPLQWSDECMVHAQKCADENADMNRLKHCFFFAELTKRKMGQSICAINQDRRIAASPLTEEQVIEKEWYAEMVNPGYNFEESGYQVGTAQFTALVWYDTTHVGMARSADGIVSVANYYPAANWADKDNFRANVLPVKASFAWRPRNSFERDLEQHFRQMARDVGSEPLVVPTQELVVKLSQLGEEKLAEAIASCDLDRNNLVDIREFTAAVTSLRLSDDHHYKDKELNRVIGFVGIDANGDGKLNADEFLRYLTRLGPDRFPREKALEILNKFDKDHDGHLDYEEFLALHDSGALEGPVFTIVVDRWEQLEHRLKDVPLKSIIDKLKRHLHKGGTAKVTRTETSIVVKLIAVKSARDRGDVVSKPEVLEGSWGERASKPGRTRNPRAGLNGTRYHTN